MSKTKNKAKKVRRTQSQWQEYLAEYETSGLTQSAFCARHSLAVSTFSKWRAQLRTQDTPQTAEAMFLDLGTVDQVRQEPDWEFELNLGQGISLRLRRSL